MLNFWIHLFDTSDFPPRWRCGKWDEGLGWLHILSDLSVCSAYLAIPIALFLFARRRTDLPFRKLFWLFSAFILFCGFTHLLEAIIFWWPAYRLSGVLKLGTGIISWITLLALLPVLPKAFALRNPAELDREIAQRRQMEVELRASEQRYRLLLDGIRDYAIYLLDPLGNVASWNSGAERIKGYSADEIIGKHFSRFYPADDRALGKTEHELEVALATGRYEGEGWRVRKDSARFWAHFVISAIYDENGKHQGFANATRDLTTQKQAEAALAERVHLAAIGTEIGVALTKGGSLPVLLQCCAQTLVRHLDAALVRIWTVAEDSERLTLRASARERLPAHTLAPLRELVDNFGDDTLAGDMQWAQREGMAGFASHSLIVEGKTLGVLNVFARNALPDATLEAMSQIARIIAGGIQRKRVEASLQRHSEQIS